MKLLEQIWNAPASFEAKRDYFLRLSQDADKWGDKRLAKEAFIDAIRADNLTERRDALNLAAL